VSGSRSLSIVVVTWRSADRLGVLVESMNRHLRGGEELIVVDNASDDDPEAAAREWRGPAVFERLDGNEGFGAASNAGVRLAKGEAVVLLNPDTVLLDESLHDLAAVALERRALAGPRLLWPDGSTQPSASGPVGGVWPWIGAIVPGALQPRALRARTEPWRLDATARVAWLTGACIAAPRDLLIRLGPFDPAIHLYGEDMDLGLGAAAADVPSLFCPDVSRVVHEGGASSARLGSGETAARVATSRRAVLRRALGPRRERRAWLAQRLNLRLRAMAKRALGRDNARERTALEAVRAAVAVPELPPRGA
jgi:GT2 family glycosyltransferase